MSAKAHVDDELLDDDFDEEEDTQEGKYLTFVLGQEECGIEIRHITEIIGLQNITDVPDMPSYIRGVINLRGKIIPVMDVRLRFGVAERAYDDRTCIIVVNVEGQAMGLIVDRVSEVVDIPRKDIQPPPSLSNKVHRFIHGMGKIGDKVKLLLDVEKTLFEEGVLG